MWKSLGYIVAFLVSMNYASQLKSQKYSRKTIKDSFKQEKNMCEQVVGFQTGSNPKQLQKNYIDSYANRKHISKFWKKSNKFHDP